MIFNDNCHSQNVSLNVSSAGQSKKARQMNRFIRNIGKIIVNKLQLLIGFLLLISGAFIYIIDRPAWQTTWFPYRYSISNSKLELFGSIGDNLPSFIHVVSFSLLTAGIITDKKKFYVLICCIWVLINTIFEIIQINHTQISRLSNWVEKYSLNGIFDFKDLLAIYLGGICAFFLLTLTKKQRL